MRPLVDAALVILLTQLFSPIVLAQNNPIEREVKAHLKDPGKPFTMFVRVKIKHGAGPRFEAAFAKAITETRKEKGNKAYDLNRSENGTEYIVYERWDNFAALQFHLKLPHITTLLEQIGDLLDGPPEVKVFFPAGE
jgi:quinol monooxygenase YgiN